MRRLVGLARPYTRALSVALGAGMVTNATVILIPLVTARIIDHAIRGSDHHLLLPLSLAVLGLGALRAASNFLRRNLSGMTSVHIEADVRARLFAHLQGLPVSFHDSWQSGQLLARATSDLNAIRMFIGFALVFLVYLALMFVSIMGLLFYFSPLLAALTLVLVAPFGVAATMFNHRMEPVMERSRQAVGEVTNVGEESTAGIRILKAFGREVRAVARLDEAALDLKAINLEAVDIRSFYIPVIRFIPSAILGLVVGVGGWQVIAGQFSVGRLIAFTQALGALLFPLQAVGWILAQTQQAQAAAGRVFEILDTQPAIADVRGARDLVQVDGEVRFDGVSYTYPGSDRPALTDVSFTVQPGETVALVGLSGSGKSTVASLVPRFDDPTGGRVVIDGQDIKTVTLRSLRRQIGVVFDEPVLFSATIRDNIAFGEPEASVADVERAARAAGAHDFIAELPHGYETRVGELGFSLSGGQRQRLALARALLFRPRILILDDPLSSVDVKTEAEIEANLRSLLRGRTTFLIAHRSSTIAMSDRVLMVDGGRIVATGSHHELLAGNAEYRRVLAADLDLDQLSPVAPRRVMER